MRGEILRYYILRRLLLKYMHSNGFKVSDDINLLLASYHSLEVIKLPFLCGIGVFWDTVRRRKSIKALLRNGYLTKVKNIYYLTDKANLLCESFERDYKELCKLHNISDL